MVRKKKKMVCSRRDGDEREQNSMTMSIRFCFVEIYSEFKLVFLRSLPHHHCHERIENQILQGYQCPLLIVNCLSSEANSILFAIIM